MARPFRFVLTAALFTVAAAGGASGQAVREERPTGKAADSASFADTSRAEVQQSGVSFSGLRAAAHRADAPLPVPATLSPGGKNLGQARAMMVVGLGGLLAGAVIGDSAGTIIMVGGAIVGLVGLYEYLK
jgi:hypothetical protein